MIGRRTFFTMAAALVIARQAHALATFRTLHGPFTQERTIGLLKATVRSRGIITLVRPDRLRWELLPPDDIVYWVTPEALAYKSRHGSGRIPPTTGFMAASLQDLRALLADTSLLRQRYDIVETPHEGGRTLEATPKNGAKSAFQKLTLELAPDLVRPVRATLIESARDKTQIVFGDLQLDTPIDPELMQPPA